MKTFGSAFNKALREAGFKRTKSLVAPNKTVPLYQGKDGQRYRLQEAVVAAVRRDG